jgi:transposase
VEEAREHPDKPVEVWTTDEHRLGLKPVRRRVWAPVGARPVALGHHRYEWLYVTAFVQPTRGETVWYLSTGIDKRFFATLLAAFARESGAGRERIVVLVLDNAGWHTEPGLAVPDGIRLVFLPPYSPELQPAERLWPLVDEPVVNRHFATLADLDAVLARRCRRLRQDHALIAAHTNFHWWPKPITRN